MRLVCRALFFHALTSPQETRGLPSFAQLSSIASPYGMHSLLGEIDPDVCLISIPENVTFDNWRVINKLT